MIRIKAPEKFKNLLSGILFLAAIGIMIYSVNKMNEIKNKDYVNEIREEFIAKENKAQKAREKISYDNFILAKRFDSIQNDINNYEYLMYDIKKDYNLHLKQFNQIRNEEKKFIPNATLSEQLDVISTVKYSEFK